MHEELKVFAEDVTKCLFQVTFHSSAIAALVRLGKVKRNMHIITLLRTCRLFLLGLQLSVFECCLPNTRSDAEWFLSLSPAAH